MSMNVERLGDSFVARVSGLDVARMSNREADDLHRAYLEHKVLVIEGQDLSVAEFDAFGQLFGETVEHPVKSFLHPDYPKVMVLSNSTRHGKPVGVRDAGSFWHSDRSYMERPAGTTILYAVEIPDQGGDTLFGDMEAVYEELPQATRDRIENLCYLSQYRWSTNRDDPESRWSMLTEAERANTPPVERPVVRTHPQTGRRSLYVFPGISCGVRGIIGMDAIESAELLDELFDHITDPRFHFRLRWPGAGTVLLWDNRCVMHKATTKDLPPEKTRTLYRISTLSDVPH